MQRPLRLPSQGRVLKIGNVGLLISIAALVLSGVTAWLTLLGRSRILMTQPTVIFFGPDGGPKSSHSPEAKVFLRTLLYSSGKRGHVVEYMFLREHRGETRQNFNGEVAVDAVVDESVAAVVVAVLHLGAGGGCRLRTPGARR
jgi:hypothetical protein